MQGKKFIFPSFGSEDDRSIQLNVAYEKLSARQMIEMGKKNVITIKDLCSFAIGGFPIKPNIFTQCLCKEFKCNPILFAENINLQHRIFSDPKVEKELQDTVYQCFERIRKFHLNYILTLYLQVFPIVDEMYKDGFPIDMDTITMIYEEKGSRYAWLSSKMKAGNDVTEEEQKEINNLKKFIESFAPSKLVKSGTNTLFADYELIGTETFRMTTHNYNLLGIPKVYRECLLPHTMGNNIVEVDMVASHIVILAVLAGEESILKKMERNEDVYAYLGSVFFDTDLQLSPEQRKIIKVTILMLLNGAGKAALFTKVAEYDKTLTMNQMSANIARLKSKFFHIQEYLEKLKVVKEICLPNDSRIWTEEIISDPYKRISRVLQTLESQILWRSLISIQEKLKDLKESRLYLTLHDAIYIECPKESAELVKITAEKIIKLEIRRTKVCLY